MSTPGTPFNGRPWWWDMLVGGEAEGYAAGVFDGRRRIALAEPDDAEVIARLQELARWLVSMDDPEDVLGREERRTITMTKIVGRAREALGAKAV